MVMDRLVCYSDEVELVPGSKYAKMVYKSTARGSPLRAVLRDYVIHESSSQYFEYDKPSNFPRQFLTDIALGYLEIKRLNESKPATVDGAFRVNVSTMARCHYHIHNSAVPCCEPSQSTPVEVIDID
jgi:hypothetical protein